MKVLVYIFALIWSVLCFPISLIIFYVMECHNLAKLISSFIENKLEKYK